ncbi:MAG: hypothetical protein IJ680_03500 [Paludibacteraceae bacterium]|nr:hypothetical protein [Eubacterium sp.]MBR1630898.1 hypothetical protein [Paludibacteraceae bacterium]
MSVIKSKRNQSSAQFLETALQIQQYTLRQCVKFPKRYTFLFTQNLTTTATNACTQVKKGNSIFPANKHEAQLRRDCFLQAYAELQALVSLISTAYDMFPIPENAIVEWMRLINEELKLLKALIKADKQRYKNLPD